jgi:hypothetical protein
MSDFLTTAFVSACARSAKLIPARLTRRGNPATGPAEQQLEDALVAALPKEGVAAHRIGARRLKIRADWDPVPNGLDFYVWLREPDGEVGLVAELKFDNVEERMWDLFKLLAARKLPGGPVALLVHGGSWTTSRPCAELFPDATGKRVEVETRRLVHSNASQWERDLRYFGRLWAAPERIRCTSHLAGVNLDSYPRYELRVVEAEPADDAVVRFKDGWPN